MWMKLFSVLMFSGVAAGAFGAHGFKEKLGDYGLDLWHTATLYLFVHSLAAFVLAVEGSKDPMFQERVVPTMYCFFIGTLIFSGSLYALALSNIKILGAVTPIGGLLFLVGWLLLAVRL